MPVPLIPCRLKDDHSTTAMIGETALIYFSEWEPIPGEDATDQDDVKSVESPQDEPDPNGQKARPEDKPATKAPAQPRPKADASAEKDKE